MATDDEVRSVREAIYKTIVEHGVAPSARDVAHACAISRARAEVLFRALAESHVIVLRPGSVNLWAAPPFSAVPNGFRVHAEGRSWFATCAWDAFGIPAALHADANVDSACSWSGEPVPCGVRGGAAFGDGVIHLLVPAARFWDDIIYT